MSLGPDYHEPDVHVRQMKQAGFQPWKVLYQYCSLNHLQQGDSESLL